MLQVIFTLMIFLAAILIPMAAVMYGSMAFGWGLHRYPRTAAMVAFLLVGTVFGGGTHLYNRIFPGCNFHWGMFGGQASWPRKCPFNLKKRQLDRA